jgi:hypothetical protein
VPYGTEIDKWINEASAYFSTQWGLDKSFASNVALLYLYFVQYGLSPKITSGFRSPEKQAELQSRYSAGDPSVVVKPATNSKHSTVDWLGNPAAQAVDISTNNPATAAQIARAIGVGAGYFFTTSDPVHFYQV